MYKFLITGGNFSNKGAQSMMMIAISEIKKRYSDADVYVLPVDNYKLYNSKRDNFKVLHNHSDIFAADTSNIRRLYLLLKNLLRALLKKDYVLKELFEFPNLMDSMDFMIDISGFCLSSQFGEEYNMQLINYINSAKKHGVSVILMPQSFGPFDYKEKAMWVAKIKDALNYCALIFAREEEGYLLLADELQMTNVLLSPDMVLTSITPDLADVFKCDTDDFKTVPFINTDNNVAIIPNIRSINDNNKCNLINIYEAIIVDLLERDKNIYILSHSIEDIQFCKEIYIKWENVPQVHFIDAELNCFQYSELIGKFDFAIASRYHSIVHAYREGIPCVVLGWAIKYNDLLNAFNQSGYMFDVRSNVDQKSILNSVNSMIDLFEMESKKISKTLLEMKKKDCFRKLEEKGIFDVRKQN